MIEFIIVFSDCGMISLPAVFYATPNILAGTTSPRELLFILRQYRLVPVLSGQPLPCPPYLNMLVIHLDICPLTLIVTLGLAYATS